MALALVGCLAIFLGGLPYVLFALFGVSFVPSSGWVDMAHLPALVLGIACGLPIGLLTLRFVAASQGERLRTGQRLLYGIGTPAFSALFIYSLIVAFVPMVSALTTSAPVSLDFTVRKVSPDDERGCPNPVKLQDLPILIPQLCGLPRDLVDGLAPGTPIVVSGQGSALGVCYTSVRRRS